MKPLVPPETPGERALDFFEEKNDPPSRNGPNPTERVLVGTEADLAAAEEPVSALVFRRASEIRIEPVRWAWDGLVPLGHCPGSADRRGWVRRPSPSTCRRGQRAANCRAISTDP